MFFLSGAHVQQMKTKACTAWLLVRMMIEGCVNACFEDFDGVRFRGTGACYSVQPLRLNWRSLRGWSVRTMKIFAGKNTKKSGIEPRIVLRASAIGKCELAVLLNARSAFE
jgi:hypothetical protein